MAHTIKNTYDAWHFLYDHPKFNILERMEISSDDYIKLETENYILSKDVGGKSYRYFKHACKIALVDNLDICYVKVDSTGTINEDSTKNDKVEVWLEFGPLVYGYTSTGSDKHDPTYEWDTETILLNFHDYHIDCGAKTFDKALVKLAKLVMKHYGDYEDIDEYENCDCPDCKDGLKFLKDHDLL